MEDVSTATATEEVEKKTGVPTSVTVLKNHDVQEETWKKYDNTYRLSKTGCGMTLLERVERLDGADLCALAVQRCEQGHLFVQESLDKRAAVVVERVQQHGTLCTAVAGHRGAGVETTRLVHR